MRMAIMTTIAFILTVLMFCGIDLSVIITWVKIFYSLF